ncbi:hypothetical protein DFH27DRAFT_246489 [Peziza echinospora]|nr:hypothetical protein DFH27DRAFT_246489 [Peziza echinospora]
MGFPCLYFVLIYTLFYFYCRNQWCFAFAFAPTFLFSFFLLLITNMSGNTQRVCDTYLPTFLTVLNSFVSFINFRGSFSWQK